MLPKNLPRLGARAHGHENNLTLIRLCAALAVLVSHTFFLVLGPGQEPLSPLGETPGSIAVEIFFVISGFLVTRSLMARRKAIDFLAARFLRIFPGLAVQALFAALVIGAMLSPLRLADYFSSPVPFSYVWNTILLTGAAGPLPGVMLKNGSLWTLPLEVALYGMVLFAWIAATVALSRPFRALSVARFLGAVAALVLAVIWFKTSGGGFKLAAMFGSGVAFHFARDRIVLSPRLAWLGLAVIVASAWRQATFHAALVCLLPYVVMCAAYLPRGRILGVNAIGDYSYGLYIYAFPVQIAVAHYLPQGSVATIAAASAAIALGLAAISWHCIESPALKARPALVALFGRTPRPRAARSAAKP